MIHHHSEADGCLKGHRVSENDTRDAESLAYFKDCYVIGVSL